MKNIFTKKTNINIIKRVAGAFKRLSAFIVVCFTIKKQCAPSSDEKNTVDIFDTLMTGCAVKHTFSASNDITHDPAPAGSFFFYKLPHLLKFPL